MPCSTHKPRNILYAYTSRTADTSRAAFATQVAQHTHRMSTYTPATLHTRRPRSDDAAQRYLRFALSLYLAHPRSCSDCFTLSQLYPSGSTIFAPCVDISCRVSDGLSAALTAHDSIVPRQAPSGRSASASRAVAAMPRPPLRWRTFGALCIDILVRLCDHREGWGRRYAEHHSRGHNTAAGRPGVSRAVAGLAHTATTGFSGKRSQQRAAGGAAGRIVR
jgi:hypothetical protein